MKRAVMSDVEKEKQKAGCFDVVKLIWTMGNEKSYICLLECLCI